MLCVTLDGGGGGAAAVVHCFHVKGQTAAKTTI